MRFPRPYIDKTINIILYKYECTNYMPGFIEGDIGARRPRPYIFIYFVCRLWYIYFKHYRDLPIGVILIHFDSIGNFFNISEK